MRVLIAAICVVVAVPALAARSGSTSATTVFSDGFESGDLAQWTAVRGARVQSDLVDEGTFAARVTSRGAPAYLMTSLAGPVRDVAYDGKVNVVSSRSTISLVRFRTSSGRAILSLIRRIDGRLAVYDEVTRATKTSKAVLPLGEWHDIGMRLSTYGDSGSYDVALDDVPVSGLSSTANIGVEPVGRLYLGDPASGRRFDVVYDSQSLGVYNSPPTPISDGPARSVSSSSASVPRTEPGQPPTTTPPDSIVPPTVITTTSTPVSEPGSTTLTPAAPGGRVFVLSPSGSDTNPGSLAQPWRTFSNALERLRSGDALYVRGGTFRERVDPRLASATSDRRILVRAYPGERPVIQGLLWLHSPNYWTFDGINVTWDPATGLASEHMVRLINGIGWSFRNAEVWGARSYGAILVAGDLNHQPDDWTIANNCVHDTYATNNTNQDQLIYANTGVTSGTGVIERNVLFNAPNGMGIKLGGPEVHVGGAANVTARYNTIYHTAQSILIGWQSHDNTLDHNVMQLVGPNYGNVRGYQLSGDNNVMYDNVGFGAKTLLLNDPGYRPVKDGGNNMFPVDPRFNDTASCSGFVAQNPAVTGYGS